MEGFPKQNESIEKDPVFVYSLFDQSKTKVLLEHKNTDSDVDIETLYNLYVGECLENNIEPMAIEALSMNRL